MLHHLVMRYQFVIVIQTLLSPAHEADLLRIFLLIQNFPSLNLKNPAQYIELSLIHLTFVCIYIFLSLLYPCWRIPTYQLYPASTSHQNSNTSILYDMFPLIVPYTWQLSSPALAYPCRWNRGNPFLHWITASSGQVLFSTGSD